MIDLKWYFTSLLVASRNAGPRRSAKWYHSLLLATNHDDAYAKSERLGHQWDNQENKCFGVGELLLVHDTPRDGAEILWSEEEMTPEVFQQMKLGQRGDARGQASMPSPSGWYLGNVVLREVHDEGSHGNRLLVWINSYLIAAGTFESAYQRAWQLGVEQQDAPGSHLCDGQNAHWEFEGIKEIIPLHDPPGDGALLWSEDLTVTEPELGPLIPNKSELGVFKWQREQLRQ